MQSLEYGNIMDAESHAIYAWEPSGFQIHPVTGKCTPAFYSQNGIDDQRLTYMLR